MSSREFEIMPASLADAEPLRAMQARSMRVLGGGYYPVSTIESFLRSPGTMDDAVLAEGRYLVARDGAGRIVGSGGWSRLQPGYAKGGVAMPMARDRAVVRSVFVEPACARQGIGGAIMRRIEDDSAAAGVETLALTATLSGMPLYGVLGYIVLRPRTLVLGDGAPFEAIEMEKRLTCRKAA
ncbi:MAG: GNAT family N-acetyltransferase [Reyranella sp.]|uniref:GNAT family N-acetyltransferase n=1 Tax=Reyranella sp. TaxID=1929291 RepID=UPI003D114C0A